MRPRAAFTLVELPIVSKRNLKAFTLVELLVVIAIIGILVAVLLPAVQAARESARKKQCMNNVRQMAIAFLHHETAQHFLPSGGWRHDWVGEPDVGYDKYQPGSWAYNILTYLEQGDLRELGSGMSILDPARDELFRRMVSTPVPLFNCPSRRPSGPFSYTGKKLAKNFASCKRNNGCLVVRGDYRANTGNRGTFGGEGPDLYVDLLGQLDASQWKMRYKERVSRDVEHNGVCYEFSMVRLADITDGAGHTAMLGEKALSSECYYGGCKIDDDDQCIYSGFDRDNNALTGEAYVQPMPPEFDRPNNAATEFRFGSAHPDGFHMAFCDGAVRLLEFEIDGRVFLKMGGRNDD